MQYFSGYDWQKAVYPPSDFVKFCRAQKMKAAQDTEDGAHESEEDGEDESVDIEVVCRKSGARLSADAHKLITSDTKIKSLVAKIQRRADKIIQAECNETDLPFP